MTKARKLYEPVEFSAETIRALVNHDPLTAAANQRSTGKPLYLVLLDVKRNTAVFSDEPPAVRYA